MCYPALFCLLFISLTTLLPQPLRAAEKNDQVSIMYYFSGEMGQSGFKNILQRFRQERQIAVIENPVGHEDFKNVALQMAAEGQLPDLISYWAGARTQFLVDSGALAPMDELWQRGRFSDLVPAALAETSTRYNGKRYLIPFGYHAVGFFYQPTAFRLAGIEQAPETWEQFLQACKQLQQVGIKPLALGAKNRWPAQFWFDYLLLRTAGPEFRQLLMVGAASYTDPKVQQAVQLWVDLLQRGYFASGTLSDDWTDAADRLEMGQAAMTLMGTWISGYWQGKQLKPKVDYDFFPFPQIDPQQPQVVVGPVDGLVMAAASRGNPAAEALLTYLLGDRQAQREWVLNQGALSPNRLLADDIYDPVLKKALQEVKGAKQFAFNYDLATPPPVAEQGLSMFSNILANPDDYQKELQKTADLTAPIFPAGQPQR